MRKKSWAWVFDPAQLFDGQVSDNQSILGVVRRPSPSGYFVKGINNNMNLTNYIFVPK
jgi:hypothetical protein